MRSTTKVLRRTLIPTEDQEMRKLIAWSKFVPEIKDIIIHIPNEGKRSIALGAKLKAMGMRSGVSDIFIPLARKGYHGLFLELKRVSGGKVTVAQQDWINKMLALDYYAIVAYGFNDASKSILTYLTYPIKSA